MPKSPVFTITLPNGNYTFVSGHEWEASTAQAELICTNVNLNVILDFDSTHEFRYRGRAQRPSPTQRILGIQNKLNIDKYG